MIPKRILNARKQHLAAMQTENSAQTYVVNWAVELDTDTISTSTWTAENNGATIANETNTTTQSSCRLSGDPGTYRITNKIVTSNGDTMERYIELRVLSNDFYDLYDYWNQVSYRGYWH